MVDHWLAVDREQPLAHGHALGRRAPGAHAQHHGWQALGAACGATHAACSADRGWCAHHGKLRYTQVARG